MSEIILSDGTSFVFTDKIQSLILPDKTTIVPDKSEEGQPIPKLRTIRVEEHKDFVDIPEREDNARGILQRKIKTKKSPKSKIR